MQVIKKNDTENIQGLLVRPISSDMDVKKIVIQILESVKQKGDDSLNYYTRKIDGVDLEEIKISDEEIKIANDSIPTKLIQAIKFAKRNISLFHESQKENINKIKITEGVTCWRKSVPIEKVGLYVPGGSSPLFSTLLMLGIPAKITGCKEIIICTPPNKEGSISNEILYTADLLNIKKIFKVGGAQAIGAMAYGTETIPRIDKIFGPGNKYVTTAKQIVNAEGIAIDMPAGPSELLIIADEFANPKFIAADLLSQAEHGEDSQVILISTSEKIISEVGKNIKIFLPSLKRQNIINKSLLHSKFILVNNLSEAFSISNNYAPEHLILAIKESEKWLNRIENAGSVFIGTYSPESAGDYASGTNHTLPTYGFAKTYSGVSLDSFVKKISFQELTKEGLKKLAPHIETMAKAEGLDAHKLAVSVRL